MGSQLEICSKSMGNNNCETAGETSAGSDGRSSSEAVIRAEGQDKRRLSSG